MQQIKIIYTILGLSIFMSIPILGAVIKAERCLEAYVQSSPGSHTTENKISILNNIRKTGFKKAEIMGFFHQLSTDFGLNNDLVTRIEKGEDYHAILDFERQVKDKHDAARMVESFFGKIKAEIEEEKNKLKSVVQEYKQLDDKNRESSKQMLIFLTNLRKIGFEVDRIDAILRLNDRIESLERKNNKKGNSATGRDVSKVYFLKKILSSRNRIPSNISEQERTFNKDEIKGIENLVLMLSSNEKEGVKKITAEMIGLIG